MIDAKTGIDAARMKTLQRIAEVQASLKNNVRHYTFDGDLLRTDIEILEKINKGEQLLVDQTDRQDIVYLDDILDDLLEATIH